MKTDKLDDLDRALVHALQINGRAPFGLIATALGPRQGNHLTVTSARADSSGQRRHRPHASRIVTSTCALGRSKARRWAAGSAIAAMVVLTFAGLLSGFGVIGRLIIFIC